MSMIANLLRKAYNCIDTGNFLDAKAILNTLLNLDPSNIEVWEMIMQLSETCEELDLLCNQALQIAELNPIDQKSLIDYYYFLRQKIKNNDIRSKNSELVTFELVNEFSFTLKDPSLLKNASVSSTVTRSQKIANFLGSAIAIMYLILFVLGLALIHFGNNFGYWVIMILILGIGAVFWNRILTSQT